MRSAAGPGARWRWVAYCAAAEAVGMTAAAAAARAGTALAGESPATDDVAAVITVVTAGGLVEGVAVGLATAAGLGPVLRILTYCAAPGGHSAAFSSSPIQHRYGLLLGLAEHSAGHLLATAKIYGTRLRVWRGAVFRDRVAGADHRAVSGPVSRARKG